ncbi:MAG: hypothetical protein WA390_01725, partial [Nitrososphaeraceae archaeon]
HKILIKVYINPIKKINLIYFNKQTQVRQLLILNCRIVAQVSTSIPSAGDALCTASPSLTDV